MQGPRRRLLQQVHANAGVRFRQLALPIEQYAGLADFGAANDAFIDAACALSVEALKGALDAAEVQPDEVDLILTASTTGLSVPSIDARIAPATGLRPDVKRLPVVGLGCAAGAAGVARIADYLAGHPDQIAVLISVELCSLTLQRHDSSVANLVASGLFGDGAGAVVLAGRNRAAASAGRQPAVLATRSRLYPDTLRAMGWDVGTSVVEVWLRRPEISPALAWSMLTLLLAAQALRWWCIRSLAHQWNTRIIVVPGLGRQRRGPYRLLSHPNYLAVIVEGAALPLVGSAWLTATAFTIAHLAVLGVRIRIEQQALTTLREPGEV